MKRYYSQALFLLLFFISSLTFCQWKTNIVGGNSGDAYYVNGKINVTSTGGSVGGDNNYQGIIVNHNNFVSGAQGYIDQAFTSVPAANLFKAKAGEPTLL